MMIWYIKLLRLILICRKITITPKILLKPKCHFTPIEIDCEN